MGSGHILRPARGSWAVGAHCACRLSAVPHVPRASLNCGDLGLWAPFISLPVLMIVNGTRGARRPSPRVGGGFVHKRNSRNPSVAHAPTHASCPPVPPKHQGHQVPVTTSLSCVAGVHCRGCRSSRSSSKRPLGEAASPAGHPRLGTHVRLRGPSLCPFVCTWLSSQGPSRQRNQSKSWPGRRPEPGGRQPCPLRGDPRSSAGGSHLEKAWQVHVCTVLMSLLQSHHPAGWEALWAPRTLGREGTHGGRGPVTPSGPPAWLQAGPVAS